MRQTILIAPYLLIVIACGPSGPPPPRTGTPGYFNKMALDTFAQGDYMKANDWLAKLSKSESESAVQSRPWRLLLLGGLMQGNRQLADDYETGARANKDRPGQFHKKVSDHRAAAASQAIELVDVYDQFVKESPSGDVKLINPYPPKGSIGRPQIVTRVLMGQMPSDSDVDTLYAQMLQRGVISETANAVGAKGDAAKAQAAFKSSPVSVPRPAFQLAMANLLYDASSIFGMKKRNEAGRQDFVLKRVQKALSEAAMDSKEAKELKTKAEADAKDAAKRK